MSSHPVQDPFPRLPLFGATALVLLALAGAAFGQFGAGRATDVPQDGARPVAFRDLRFADRADGAVLVYQADKPTPITVVTGQAGFLRGSLRALARVRRMDGEGASAPFRLTAWSDGRLTLADAATGERLELEAFGSDNAAVFARLLNAGSAR